MILARPTHRFPAIAGATGTGRTIARKEGVQLFAIKLIHLSRGGAAAGVSTQRSGRAHFQYALSRAVLAWWRSVISCSRIDAAEQSLQQFYQRVLRSIDVALSLGVSLCRRNRLGSVRNMIFTDVYRFLQIFRRLVLGWIDSYDSNQILIFSGFSRSTKLSG